MTVGYLDVTGREPRAGEGWETFFKKLVLGWYFDGGEA